MKVRIVETLQDLKEGNHSLKYELCQTLGFDDKQIKEQAAKVLKNILHNYSVFSISTIDSFFQKVVRIFAREIGVQGGFLVELDQRKVISESVDQMLLEVGQNKKLSKWLTDFAFHNIAQGKKWDAKKDIKSLSDELFKETFIFNKEEIFSKMEIDGFMPSYMASLNQIKHEFTSSMQDLGIKAIELMKAQGITADDFTYKESGVGGYFLKFSKGIMPDPKSPNPGKRVFAALEEDKWYSNSSDAKGAIEVALASGLADILAEMIAYHQENYKLYFTALSVVNNIFTLGILSEVANYIHQYRDENDTLLISDFPIFLNQIIRDSDTPYIYEKIGARYKHYLIDEFQDTSGLQWNNFKPLVKDSIASDNFNMIVGDIKQSIYRWRGGNWKLLLQDVEQDIGAAHVNVESLNTNWRSRKNIIDFNNKLFEAAPNLLYEDLKVITTENIAGIENVKNAYSDTFQQIPDKDNVEGGLVEVKFFEIENKEEYNEQAMALMIEKIELLQDANYQLKDIAILVRTAREGKIVTDALIVYEKENLDSKYAYDIISNDSLYLKNAPSVNFLIQSLKYIMDDKESLHKTQLDYAMNWHLPTKDSFSHPEAILQPILTYLKSLALVDLIEEIVRLFDLASNDVQRVYLLAFQDAVLDYSKHRNAGIEGFLLWWDENNQRSVQVSENQNAIRLLTIHKSKGLQFKTVIIPFCTWGLDNNSSGENQTIVWCDTTGKEPFDRLPLLPLKYKQDMANTMFATDYLEEKTKAYLDNLNLLYVACTRAEEVLYVMADVPKRKDKLSGIASVLYQYMSKNEAVKTYWNKANLHYSNGKMLAYSVYENQQSYQIQMLDNYISKPWNEREELQVKGDRFWFDENLQAKITEGEMLHWLLSKIKTIKDIEQALFQLAVKYGLDESTIELLKSKMKQLLSISELKSWFAEGCIIKNEVNIIDANGGIIRPDRVVISNNKAIVIDYKTGIAINKHHNQVRSYQLVLQDMGYQNVKGYLLYIGEGEVVEVV